MKIVFTVIGIFLTIASVVVYYREMFRGNTKPHMFTWLIWTTLTGIAFVVQLNNGGGFGSWVLGVSTITAFGVLVFSLFRGEKDIKVIDWISLAAAGIALLLWLFAKQPLTAIILVTLTDCFGYIPTIRKSLAKPYEEPVSSYVYGFFKFGIGVFAVDQLSLLTGLYSGALAVMSLVVVIILVRGQERMKK